MTLYEANHLRKVCLENFFPVPQVEIIDNDSEEVRLCFTPSMKFEIARHADMVIQALIREKGHQEVNENIGV